MAPSSAGMNGYSDAKDFLDRIGQQVYDKIKEEIATYKDDLKGNLASSSILGEIVAFSDPCKLIKDEGHKLLAARGDPCKKDGAGNDVERFSDKEGAECDNRKIEGNSKTITGKDFGACAPYRRLSLCNRNLEKIPTSTTKHDLLAEVCMAANYEAQSLIPYHDKYREKYPDSPSQLCSVLARSFADIGDIVRGRDLYRGSGRRKTKLQDNLKKIFKEIHSDVTSGRTNAVLQARYKGDDPDFFKLREDWWTANRETVWKALTCDDDNKLAGAHYFRATCGDTKGPSVARNQCRCDGPNADPPTYFDYVPQYLRWFEEWTEDFCRKKKKKLENAKNKCRGDKNEKYCSLNGCDCTKTVRAKGKLRYGNRCTDCLYACNSYVEWIDKQRNQFDKQKNKYHEEITRGGSRRVDRTKLSTRGGSDHKGYEKKFYEKLQSNGYGTVDALLDLLSKEKECENIKDDKGGKINFKEDHDKKTNVYKGIFYHSEYCQPCPYCGMKKRSDGKGWEEKRKNDQCKGGNLYKPKDDAKPTPIKILKSGGNHDDIRKKIDAFCEKESDESLYAGWKCYKVQDVENVRDKNDDDEDDEEELSQSGGICILENQKNKEKETNSQKEPDVFQKTFYDFFTYWVAHMLKDSIYWRTKKLDRCLQNGKPMKCKNGCNTKCDCFEKWVLQKKKEWTAIKDHFSKQGDIVKEGDIGVGMTPDFVLEGNLKEEFYKENSEEDTEEKSENNLDAEEAEELKHIREIIQSEENEEEDAAGANGKKTIMDKLIEHEEKEAKNCLKTHTNDTCPQQPKDKSPGRSLDPEEDHHSDSDEEEEEHGPEDHQEEEVVEETVAEVTETTQVNVCETVKNVFSDVEKLKDACSTKYINGHEKFPNWKCISSGSDSGGDNTSGEAAKRRSARSIHDYRNTASAAEHPNSDGDSGEQPTSAVTTTKSGDTGGLCIPPRRRRLYVGKLEEWAEKVGNTGESRTQVLDVPSSTETTESSLLHAFVESAAVETFFLWHKYKVENTKTQSGSPLGGMEGPFGSVSQTAGITALSGTGVGPYIPKGAGPPGGLGGEEPSVGEPMPPVLPVPPGFPPGPQIPPPSQSQRGSFPTGGTSLQAQPLLRIDGSSGTLGDSGEETPEKMLQSGKIPPDFLRLMFYTLGDYRDILFGKDISGNENIKEIENKIQQILPKNGDKLVPQNIVTSPQTWWKTNGEHIWNGMICALTYKENEAMGKPPTQDPTVKSALLDNEGKKPKNPQYEYNTVTLKDDDENGGPRITSSSPKDNPPKLTEFVERPPYFRYLEEWGQNFCKERKKRLEQIKEDCKVDEDGGRRGGKKCSGYGEHCEDNLFNKKYDTLPSLECPGCGKSCRFYKKWISRKKIEFDEQKKAYVEQQKKYQRENDDAGTKSDKTSDNEFLEKLKQYTSIDLFLQKLEPCKNENGNDEIKFDEKHKTFKQTEYCDPCPQFNINCNNGNCKASQGNTCQKKSHISTNDIKNEEHFTEEIVMRVSNDSEKEFPTELTDACETAGIFKGIRKNVWKCRNVCGYVVCKPQNVNGNKNGENQIIIIRALVTHWVEYFLDDYNKINKKLNPCMKDGEGYQCIKDCVEKWIQNKREEWRKIKELYLQQYKNNDQPDYPVKIILEELDPQTAFKKAIKPCNDLNAFEGFCGLNGTESSKGGKKHENNDFVLCLLKKLEDKAKTCEQKHQNSGDQTKQTCENSHPEPEEPLEETENQVAQPNICPKPPEPAKEEPDGTCEEAPTTPPELAPSADSGKETPVLKPEKEAPAPEPPAQPEAKKKKTKPKRSLHPTDDPWEPLKNAMLSNTIMWSIGIGFAAFSYFFIKKKTKSSVGNLFQILQIPKGDYDIPTLKSSNRYIPYASDRYKGKTYIYMEGDSNGDEKYAFMSDTTDVTSSESEYEELDINDIYVPGSPKYKTLIEVVLEPSKRDIHSDDTPSSDTPSSDTPSSDTPSNKFTDNEWNQLKKNFISNMLQNTQNTEPNILHDNVDNNTHPTMSRHNVDQKPFIMSIHDRNLYIGQEYSYDMSTNSGENNLYSGQNNVYSGIDPTSDNRGPYSDKNDPISYNHHPYSGIDLINDALNGDYDIYDEILKRKENELFGTKHHTKHTNIYNVAKPARDDPITNQINLFHKWLDRHRDMCEKWDTNNKVDILNQLKEEWENHNNSGNKPSNNKTLSSDVSIQIHMDNPKTMNEFTNMDTYPNNSIMDSILDEIEKYNEPYYDFYEDNKPSVDDNIYVDHNNKDLPTEIHIEMDVNNHKVVKEKYPVSDMWDI
ncbi:erythrocyte membrane protein 1, PfEMP1, putative [Plasmodium sp. gorilla clade G1]|nr:erythrocyte membrane protein 1, PfEMP1, putative [Plasmodium sp. gorilla clade G1]